MSHRQHDVVIATTKRKKAKPYDKLIRSFKYSAALDSVLGVRPPQQSIAVDASCRRVD